MNKTLKISFSLKNTYRVNGVLFSLKQIPLVKRLLPATLYQVKGLKIFANILSVLWEIVSVFLGKFLYFITMVCGIGILYNGLPENEVFLHILLILTVIGSFVNTHLFNPTKDKYYAMILMKMDAREYTLVNYFYSILKVVVGFLPFTILFGMDRGVPLWFCLLLPLCIAGMKLFAAAVTLWDYEKRGFGYNENKLSKYVWCCIALLLAAAYAPPAFGFALPAVVPMVIFLACIPLGMASITRLTTFRDYYAINKELLAGLTNQMDSTAQTKLIKQANEKKISADTSISSNRKGFEYLNELFIKRHKKILWNSTKKISYVCAFLVAAVLAGVYLLPEEKTVDIDRSVEFYKKVFGLHIIMDFGANKTLTGGLALQTAETYKEFIGTSDISFGGNNFELYFEEDDFDKFADKLKECDIEYIHPIMEHSWGQRVVRFYDPDKHIIEVGENMKVVCKRFLDSGMTPEQVAKRMNVPMKFINACMR